MMASLDRHLKNKGCTLSIVRDREFSSSKEVLEDKAKQLRLAGRGKRPNKARQVSEEEEKILEERKTQGKNPESLIQTDFHELFSPFLQLTNFKNIEKMLFWLHVWWYLLHLNNLFLHIVYVAWLTN